MVYYRRNRVAGGTYFFTVALNDRRATTLVDYIDILRTAFSITLRRRPFRIDALVVLPDHLHTLWTLPQNDADYPGRWRAVKSRFTRAAAQSGLDVSQNSKGEYDLWQRRYWEHTIRNEADWARHADYIHFNPVKHGHVRKVGDWPFSSFHRYVQQGLYPSDWSAEGAHRHAGHYGE